LHSLDSISRYGVVEMLENRMMDVASVLEDAKEGLRALQERRPGRFEGR
ncbi:2-(1,2-epoxy-1,2-dihydrophenyl)acetyl-CoA isomerase, partial [Pseudomonas aeruginosa]|nr:2-(1,2-epoxy-1,2-dihydrophenyl)acetyl-CoA isomerase [Pseudomonas aeruginosa]